MGTNTFIQSPIQSGTRVSADQNGSGVYTSKFVTALLEATDRSGVVGTGSVGLTIDANADRNSLVFQNVGQVPIGYAEFGEVPVIGQVGTFTLAVGEWGSAKTTTALKFCVDGPDTGVLTAIET